MGFDSSSETRATEVVFWYHSSTPTDLLDYRTTSTSSWPTYQPVYNVELRLADKFGIIEIKQQMFVFSQFLYGLLR